VEIGQEAGFQKVRAWGPGLKTGMVGKSADFVVEAIGTEVGTLGEIFATVIISALSEEKWIQKKNSHCETFILDV